MSPFCEWLAVCYGDQCNIPYVCLTLQDLPEPADLSMSLKGMDARAIKACAGEIVRAGAALHDALAAERDLRDARARALAEHYDAEYVERAIGESVAQVGIPQLLQQLD